MNKLILTALSAMLLSTPALAQNSVTPCQATNFSASDDASIKREIRRLRREGFKVEVTRNATKRTVSEGPVTFPIGLSRARVPVSGC